MKPSTMFFETRQQQSLSFILLLVCVQAYLVVAIQAAEQNRPNILLIVADDLGYRDLSCYGASKVKTPRIDQLASEGVSFTDAHSICSTCMPSRYAILTGS